MLLITIVKGANLLKRTTKKIKRKIPGLQAAW